MRTSTGIRYVMFCAAFVVAATGSVGKHGLPLALEIKPVIQPGNYEVAWMNIVASARQQATDQTRYDASYVRLEYPGGDVPADQGACTDVVIRAFRHAGYDLQELIHEDARARPRAYPRINRLDRNIDHRRCPNQIAFLKKHGLALDLDADWLPGDIVFWKLPDGRDHTGVISDRIGDSGLPMVIHNIGTCAEEDCLTEWDIVGHYRFPRE